MYVFFYIYQKNQPFMKVNIPFVSWIIWEMAGPTIDFQIAGEAKRLLSMGVRVIYHTPAPWRQRLRWWQLKYVLFLPLTLGE